MLYNIMLLSELKLMSYRYVMLFLYNCMENMVSYTVLLSP